MRVLIIGCGYVGLCLGAELVRQGHEVFGSRRNAAAHPELKAAGITPLTIDLTRPADLARLAGRVDWVVNCAASGGGTVEDYQRVYLQGTKNLIDRLVRDPTVKLVYTSSTSVYGQNDGSVVTEQSLVQPESEAARVLVETEAVILDAAKSKGLPAVILRVAGIYGPDRTYWLKRFLQDEARLEGQGGRILNMIHRDDVVGSVVVALEKGCAGQIYNAVDDQPVSQLELFQWLAEALDRQMPPSAVVFEEGGRKRVATSKWVSNTKLRRELGYRFKYCTFRQGYAAEILRLRRAGVIDSKPGSD